MESLFINYLTTFSEQSVTCTYSYTPLVHSLMNYRIAKDNIILFPFTFVPKGLQGTVERTGVNFMAKPTLLLGSITPMC